MNEASIPQAIDTLKKLYTCYMETDASLAEINPLIHEGDGTVKALDAKFNFDSNALFRQPEIVAMRDLDEEDADEIEASKFDPGLHLPDGNIGCLVNGAGLAMATMDTIKLFGAESRPTSSTSAAAPRPRRSPKPSRSCSRTRRSRASWSTSSAASCAATPSPPAWSPLPETHLSVPLVVRMKGTNEDPGQEDPAIPVCPSSADSMAEAATKIVAAVK